ncbi:MAG: phosphate ABC transporter substrate-binding protein [Pirellulaceae bacterium]|nr:MAG: phosphate ABC transporter substrate-binding protein [Pirellulaceae bacterium]
MASLSIPHRLLLLLLISAITVLAATWRHPSRSARVVVTGSSTIAPLMAEIGREFERLHPGIHIDVQTGGSSRGIVDVRRGLADVGMVSRSLRAEEADLTAHLIARDGIGLIVHADNPVRELKREEIVALFTGQLSNWQQLGWLDLPVVIVHKASGRSTHELFLEHFGLSDRDIDADVVIGDNEQGIKTVGSNRAAIGYVSIGAAEYAQAHGQSIRLLPLEGIAPSSDELMAGRYPLARQLNLVTRGTPSPPAQQLIDFTLSSEAAPMIRRMYFVPHDN